MANTIVQTKIRSLQTLKVEDAVVLGRNWAFEIWELVAGSDNDATTEVIASGLTTPIFVTVSPLTDENVTTYNSISGNDVTIGFHAAPTTATYRVKIEGLA